MFQNNNRVDKSGAKPSKKEDIHTVNFSSDSDHQSSHQQDDYIPFLTFLATHEHDTKPLDEFENSVFEKGVLINEKSRFFESYMCPNTKEETLDEGEEQSPVYSYKSPSSLATGLSLGENEDTNNNEVDQQEKNDHETSKSLLKRAWVDSPSIENEEKDDNTKKPRFEEINYVRHADISGDEMTIRAKNKKMTLKLEIPGTKNKTHYTSHNVIEETHSYCHYNTQNSTTWTEEHLEFATVSAAFADQSSCSISGVDPTTGFSYEGFDGISESEPSIYLKQQKNFVKANKQGIKWNLEEHPKKSSSFMETLNQKEHLSHLNSNLNTNKSDTKIALTLPKKKLTYASTPSLIGHALKLKHSRLGYITEANEDDTDNERLENLSSTPCSSSIESSPSVDVRFSNLQRHQRKDDSPRSITSGRVSELKSDMETASTNGTNTFTEELDRLRAAKEAQFQSMIINNNLYKPPSYISSAYHYNASQTNSRILQMNMIGDNTQEEAQVDELEAIFRSQYLYDESILFDLDPFDTLAYRPPSLEELYHNEKNSSKKRDIHAESGNLSFDTNSRMTKGPAPEISTSLNRWTTNHGYDDRNEKYLVRNGYVDPRLEVLGMKKRAKHKMKRKFEIKDIQRVQNEDQNDGLLQSLERVGYLESTSDEFEEYGDYSTDDDDLV